MDRVASEQQMKTAFRVAYNFMDAHCAVLKDLESYKAFAGDLAVAFAENKSDPLTCRLISAVFDYVCATSERNGEWRK